MRDDLRERHIANTSRDGQMDIFAPRQMGDRPLSWLHSLSAYVFSQYMFAYAARWYA
jgi:hypothetical protein